MMWLLYILLGLIGLLILLLLIAVVHTFMIGRSTHSAAKPAVAFTEAERDKYVGDLSQMIQCETISLRGADDLSKFDRFHAVLAQLFPLIHEKLEKTEIDGSLLFRWPGKSHDHAVLLMSHQDVVEATGEWKYPPFAGKIAEGRIWGRGTMDTKGSLCAILEAVEELLRENFTPSCDVYVASSCNEEIMGDGAPKTAEYLQAHGVKLDLVARRRRRDRPCADAWPDRPLRDAGHSGKGLCGRALCRPRRGRAFQHPAEKHSHCPPRRVCQSYGKAFALPEKIHAADPADVPLDGNRYALSLPAAVRQPVAV